jgi:hypothetical protein
MRSCRFFILLACTWLPVSLLAQRDCTVVQAPETASSCAIKHADFLYGLACGAGPCRQHFPDVEKAYASAATLWCVSHQCSSKAVDAYWAGYLQARAWRLPAANSSYANCVKLATTPAEGEMRTRCAAQLVKLACGMDPKTSGCNQRVAELEVRERSSGAHASGALSSSDDEAPAPDVPAITNVRIEMPPADEIDAMRDLATAKEKSDFQRATRNVALTLQPPR